MAPQTTTKRSRKHHEPGCVALYSSRIAPLIVYATSKSPAAPLTTIGRNPTTVLSPVFLYSRQCTSVDTLTAPFVPKPHHNPYRSNVLYNTDTMQQMTPRWSCKSLHLRSFSTRKQSPTKCSCPGRWRCSEALVSGEQGKNPNKMHGRVPPHRTAPPAHRQDRLW